MDTSYHFDMALNSIGLKCCARGISFCLFPSNFNLMCISGLYCIMNPLIMNCFLT